MPQKLNKAGKMQDYIPKGNGDASGEYGTSNGTNKNFTTSDKKSSANVITENKSVVVEKAKPKVIPYNEWIKKPGAKEKLKENLPKFVDWKNKNDKLNKVLNEDFINFDSIDEDIRTDLIKQIKGDFEKIKKDGKYNKEDVKKVVESYNAWYSGSFSDKDIQKLTDGLNSIGNNKANIIDGDLTGIKKNEVFNNLMKGKGSVEELKQVKDNLKINDASFTTNYNSVKNQEAIYENGNEKISFRFTTDYDPQKNIGTPQKPIKTTISSVLYKNGNVVGIRVIEEVNTKSYKNAEKQYKEMMDKWKEATGQKNISWK